MCNGCEQLSVFLGHWAGWHPTAARPTAPGPAATTRGGVTPPTPLPPPPAPPDGMGGTAHRPAP